MDIVLALKSAVSYSFYVSFKTGQFIVTNVNSLVQNLLSILNKFLILLTIILEDFTIFLQDVVQRIYYILGIISYFGECVVLCGSSIIELINNFQQLIMKLIGQTFIGVGSILNGIGNIFTLIKHIIVLFGQGVWFIIIFIPNSLISLGPICLNYFKNSCVQIYNNIYLQIELIYNFITDVPTESVIGLLIALSFVYIFLQFYSVIFRYVKRKITSFFTGLRLKYNYLKRSINRSLQNLRQRRSIQIYDEPSTSYNNIEKKSDINDGFCIICQDSVRCILILPCKHLCLCSECTARLMRYDGKCPICRMQIRRTMKVYT